MENELCVPDHFRPPKDSSALKGFGDRIPDPSLTGRKTEKFDKIRIRTRSTDQLMTDPDAESLSMDSALSPGSPSSRRGSGMWKRTSGSCPIHPKSTERSGRRALLTKRAPGSRITRCRPSDYRRTRVREVGSTRLRIAPPTIRVRVPDQSLPT